MNIIYPTPHSISSASAHNRSTANATTNMSSTFFIFFIIKFNFLFLLNTMQRYKMLQNKQTFFELFFTYFFNLLKTSILSIINNHNPYPYQLSSYGNLQLVWYLNQRNFYRMDNILPVDLLLFVHQFLYK